LNWIGETEIVDAIKEYGKNDYGNYLKNLLIKT
jgi:hypothetical protein